MGRIQLKSVTKSFGDVQVIPPLDLTIEDGEFTVFVGPSGCGKSTLLRLIAGLEDMTSGSMEIDGTDATDVPPAKRGLAMVFQSYALYPHMTVRKNIAFPLRMAKLDQAEIDRRVDGAASVLNLTDYLDRRPGQLSGGQRQRVAIARAIVRQPKILIADEPTTALDVTIQAQILELLISLQQKNGMALVLITHDMGVVAETAERVQVQYAGQRVEEQYVKGLFSNPNHPYTAALLSALPERATGRKLPSIPGVVPGQFDRPPACLFAPRCELAKDVCNQSVTRQAEELGSALCNFPVGTKRQENKSAAK